MYISLGKMHIISQESCVLMLAIILFAIRRAVLLRNVIYIAYHMIVSLRQSFTGKRNQQSYLSMLRLFKPFQKVIKLSSQCKKEQNLVHASLFPLQLIEVSSNGMTKRRIKNKGVF